MDHSGFKAVDPSDGLPTGPVPLDDERDALVILAASEGVGPLTIERLLEAFGSATEVIRVARRPGGASVLQAAVRDPDAVRSRMTAPAAAAVVKSASNPESVLASLRAANVHAVILDDPWYPNRLRLIELPPRVLFVHGADAALESASAVAVVGTRRPTDLGRRTADRIGAALARAGALVVSGLALGIDGAVHAAVVDTSGTTVAVIGGGHGRLAPTAHDRLAAAIVDGGGAVISEHAPDVEPSRGTFPRRNRIISGLADAVVVVEAGPTSGALLTAAWALEQGRECFLVPGSIDAPQSAGCLAWLRDYAGVTRIVAGVPQLLEDLGLAGGAAYPTERAGSDAAGRHAGLRPPAHVVRGAHLEALALDLPIREGMLLRALAAGATTADEIAAVADLPIGAVLAGLTGLEMRGLIDGAYGRYDISRHAMLDSSGREPARRVPPEQRNAPAR
ncbi:MAG: DNA-protecting protein DprA [Chloroflexi bacterium]|nr:DNA-protecting protein DprA [Chloroflexota bacterium]